jgi:hypothetical protein
VSIAFYSLYSSLALSVVSWCVHLVFNQIQQDSTSISVVLVIEDGNGQRHLILTPLEGHLRCKYSGNLRNLRDITFIIITSITVYYYDIGHDIH